MTRALERPEDDDAVDPVEELGPERLRDGLLDRRRSNAPAGVEPERPAASGSREPRFEVRMMTPWRKSAVAPALVGQAAVVEDLQEQVPDVRVGLLELVEQHDRERLLRTAAISGAAVRLAAASPSSRSRLSGVWYSLMSSRTIRSARAEQVLGERLGDLGLAGAGRADEEEDAERPRRVGETRLDQRDALDEAVDRLRLADHAARRRTPRSASRSSGARSSSTCSGSPVASPSVASTVSSASRRLAAPRRDAVAPSSSRRSRFPGDAAAGR